MSKFLTMTAFVVSILAGAQAIAADSNPIDAHLKLKRWGTSLTVKKSRHQGSSDATVSKNITLIKDMDRDLQMVVDKQGFSALATNFNGPQCMGYEYELAAAYSFEAVAASGKLIKFDVPASTLENPVYVRVTCEADETVGFGLFFNGPNLSIFSPEMASTLAKKLKK